MAECSGAAGAVLAVIIDRHIERKNRSTEETRQLRNIAKALALEIDEFTRYCELLVRSLKGVSRQTARQIPLELPPSNAFPVYAANGDRIGEFQTDETAAVVAFFSSAERIISTVREGVRAQAQSFANRDENANSLSNIQLAAILTGLAEDSGPRTVSLAVEARKLLLRRAGSVESA